LKKFLFVLKRILIAVSIAGSLGGILFILIAANRHQQQIPVKKFNVAIDFTKALFFVSEDDVQTEFNNLFPDSAKRNIRNINLNALEKLIESNPFVANAEVYADMKGEVFAEIVQKEPLLRVINNNGVSYYLDINGKKMPVSDNFTARVPVATGYIENTGNIERDSILQKQLFDVISFIRKDTFLLALCEQIDVDDKGEMEVIPKLSMHRFLIGDAADLEGKFKRMKIFYNEIMKSDTVSSFTFVNLKFKNQIVCAKN
jgi:cell division protein FtsQ